MKSDFLSLVLPDDRVGKITRPCPFVRVNTSGRVDSLDSAESFGMSLGKTLQSPSLLLVKSWKYTNLCELSSDFSEMILIVA